MDTLHNHEFSNYGGICAMFTLGLEVVKSNIADDLQLILVSAQICLAVLGSIFYAYSIKKIKKEDK